MTLFGQMPFDECGQTLMMPDAEMIDGKAYAVIYRLKNISQTCQCPFCGLSHAHDETDGLKETHCILTHRKGKTVEPIESFKTDIGEVYKKDGYVVRSLSFIKTE